MSLQIRNVQASTRQNWLLGAVIAAVIAGGSMHAGAQARATQQTAQAATAHWVLLADQLCGDGSSEAAERGFATVRLCLGRALDIAGDLSALARQI